MIELKVIGTHSLNLPDSVSIGEKILNVNIIGLFYSYYISTSSIYILIICIWKYILHLTSVLFHSYHYTTVISHVPLSSLMSASTLAPPQTLNSLFADITISDLLNLNWTVSLLSSNPFNGFSSQWIHSPDHGLSSSTSALKRSHSPHVACIKNFDLLIKSK